jgi:hypothetical protein
MELCDHSWGKGLVLTSLHFNCNESAGMVIIKVDAILCNSFFGQKRWAAFQTLTCRSFHEWRE